MKRRPRRRGTIAPPTDKRATFLARLSLGVDPATGQRVRLNRGFSTRKDAEQWLTSQLARADQGDATLTGSASRITLGQWLDEWAEVWSRRVSPRTREKALESLAVNLTPALRARPLRAITPAELQRRLQELQEAGKGPATVHYFYRVLRARLNEAKDRQKLGVNPFDRVHPPKVAPRDGRTLTATEAREFLALCRGTRYGALWAVLLFTGIRPEEALALRWEDVQGETLIIRRALVRSKDAGAEFRGTKSGKPRQVPLSPSAMRLLTAHRAEQAKARLQLGGEYAGQGLVFASGFGAALQWPTVVARHFKPLVARLALRLTGQADTPPPAVKGRRAEREDYQARATAALAKTGLARLRAYDLRHTAATLMIADGVSPKTVQEILGHSDVALTLRVYGHAMPGDHERGVGRLEEAIQGAAR